MKQAPNASTASSDKIAPPVAGNGNSSSSNKSRPIAGKKTFPGKPVTPDRKNPITPGTPPPKQPQEISTAHYKLVTLKTMQSIADTLDALLRITKIAATETSSPDKQKAIQIATGDTILPHMPIPGEPTYTVAQFAEQVGKALTRSQITYLSKEATHWARCLDRGISQEVHAKRPIATHRESLLKELFKYHNHLT